MKGFVYKKVVGKEKQLITKIVAETLDEADKLFENETGIKPDKARDIVVTVEKRGMDEHELAAWLCEMREAVDHVGS